MINGYALTVLVAVFSAALFLDRWERRQEEVDEICSSDMRERKRQLEGQVWDRVNLPGRAVSKPEVRNSLKRLVKRGELLVEKPQDIKGPVEERYSDKGPVVVLPLRAALHCMPRERTVRYLPHGIAFPKRW